MTDNTDKLQVKQLASTEFHILYFVIFWLWLFVDFVCVCGAYYFICFFDCGAARCSYDKTYKQIRVSRSLGSSLWGWEAGQKDHTLMQVCILHYQNCTTSYSKAARLEDKARFAKLKFGITWLKCPRVESIGQAQKSKLWEHLPQGSKAARFKKQKLPEAAFLICAPSLPKYSNSPFWGRYWPCPHNWK